MPAPDEQVHFLLVSGKLISEPVGWHGPISADTFEELETAFEEREKGSLVSTGLEPMRVHEDEYR